VIGLDAGDDRAVGEPLDVRLEVLDLDLAALERRGGAAEVHLGVGAVDRIDEENPARVGGDGVGSGRIERAGAEIDAGAHAVDDRLGGQIRGRHGGVFRRCLLCEFVLDRSEGRQSDYRKDHTRHQHVTLHT
jgi:hypothetical protein